MSPHTSHKRGLDVDMRPLRTDGHHAPDTIYDPAYSRDRTLILVQLLFADGSVYKVLFNDTTIKGVHAWPGHDNHLHARMKE